MINFFQRQQNFENYGVYTDLFIFSLLLILTFITGVFLFKLKNKSSSKKLSAYGLLYLLMVPVFLQVTYPLAEEFLYPKDEMTTYIPRVNKDSVIYVDAYKMKQGMPVLTKLSINIYDHEMIKALVRSKYVSNKKEQDRVKKRFDKIPYFYNLAARNVGSDFERREFFVDFILDNQLQYLRLNTKNGISYFKTSSKFQKIFQNQLNHPVPRNK